MMVLFRLPVLFMFITMILVVAGASSAYAIDKAEYERLLEAAHKKIAEMEKAVKNGDSDALGETLNEYSDDASGHHDRIVKTEIVKTEPLVKGQERDVTIRLLYEDDGTPVTEDRLQVFHTKPLHLLVNEPQLNDYKHVHPHPTDIPGEYKFTVVPDTDCSYRVWADMYPVDGPEQNTWTPLKGAKDCSDKPVQTTKNTTAKQDGFQYILSMSTAQLAKNQDTLVYVDVTDENGQAFMGLQPVMGAYAHLVGFYKGFEDIAHIHPLGEPTSDPADRGGPTMEFHVRPSRSGYVRYFLQVLIDDEMRFIPFGMDVAEKGPYSGQDRTHEIMMQSQSGGTMMDYMGTMGNAGAADYMAGVGADEEADDHVNGDSNNMEYLVEPPRAEENAVPSKNGMTGKMSYPPAKNTGAAEHNKQ